jgi:hypothetical protein
MYIQLARLGIVQLRKRITDPRSHYSHNIHVRAPTDPTPSISPIDPQLHGSISVITTSIASDRSDTDDDILKIKRAIIHGEDVVDDAITKEVEVGRHVPLVRPRRHRHGVPPAPSWGQAAQHLLLVDTTAFHLQRQQYGGAQPHQQRRALLVVDLPLVGVPGAGGRRAGRWGAGGVGREADEARAVGEGAGLVQDERQGGGGGQVPAGVHADVGDPVGVRRVVAELHLPLRRAVLVVLVRAPKVGPATRKIKSTIIYTAAVCYAVSTNQQ